MGNINIYDVKFHQLNVFSNESGKLFHHVRSDSSFFKQFGEVYYSLTYPGVVKGWKIHEKINQLFVVPLGMMRVVLYDLREGSPCRGKFDVIDLGEDNYGALQIPANIWYAFSPLGSIPSLIANQIDRPYDASETRVLPLEAYLTEHASTLWGNK